MATTFDGKTINIDPRDYSGMLKLMDRADEFDSAWLGKNDKGETVMISINEDNITVETFQHNDWVRENIYYRDFTTEELFHK